MSTLIAEIIKTRAGYSAQVDLNLWFKNNAQNLNTLKRYKPIASHRVVFQRIVRALDNADKRAYLITGNYGTGKSHLALMLANYFAYPSTQTDLAIFLDNYAEEDRVEAEKLRLRRQKGRYLIALCDFDSSDDFGEVVLRAALSALQEAGLAEELNTPYEQARHKLETLEIEQKTGHALVNYAQFFETQLPSRLPGVSMKNFKDRLYPGMDRTALSIFKHLHQDVLRTPFTYEAGNLSAILNATLRSPAFKQAYEGMVFFWDEFGYTLGNPNRLSLDVFQQFTQLCSEFDPERGKLIFIATAHKDFIAYAPAWAAADYSKISDRIEPVNLFPEGLEDVVRAIVEPQRDHPLWQEMIAPRANPIWSQWIPASKNSGIFDWLVNRPPVFRQKILEGIYPMHPMAVYAVIRLARSVASQNRTVFTFFSSESDESFEDGSYLWYIHNYPILNDKDQLNFFTVDQVFDYFQARLRTDNPDLGQKPKDIVSNYEASLIQLQRARNRNPLELSDLPRINAALRTLLIYDLIGVNNSLENLAFGLNLPSMEKPILESQLKELTRFGVLHLNPATKLYEFRRSDIFEVDQKVEEYKRDPNNQPGNLAVELNTLASLPKKDQYLEAKSYNAQHNEDKRLERRIISPGDLSSQPVMDGKPGAYFDVLEAEIDKEIRRGGDFEGLALYVVCESSSEIAHARDLAAKNSSPRIVVAIPNSPILFKDSILNLKAIQAIKNSEEAKTFSTQDNALVLDREKAFQQALDKLRVELVDHRKVTWIGSHGNALMVDPNRPDDPANRVMQALYTRRTTFSHDDFNLIHNVRNFSQPHLSLVEAVNTLLKVGQDVTIDNDQPENRGERRYLQRCLYQRGALAQISTKGNITKVEVDRDLVHFEQFLPALVDMIKTVRDLKSSEKILLRDFIQKYRQPPYGLGSISLVLLLAVTLRYFGDTIKIKKNDAAITDLRITDFDTAAEIVRGNYSDGFIRYRDIQPGERTLIMQVYNLFAQSASAAQEHVSISNAYETVAAWADNLPPIARVESFYPVEVDKPALRLLTVINTLHARDPHALVLGELQTVVGFDVDELVTPQNAVKIIQTLGVAKEQIEATLEQVQSGIRDGLCHLFNIQGSTWDDLADGVREWYNKLDNNQRAVAAGWHNDASKPLIKFCADLSNTRELFLEKLPDSPSYGFGKVRSWNANLSHDYLAKVNDGIQHIEANRIKVTSPAIELSGKYRQERDNVFFSGPLTLRLVHPDSGVRIILTDSGLDPLTAKERTEFRSEKTIDIYELTQARRQSVTLRYISQDTHGNLGVLEALTFYDETLENEIRLPKSFLEDKLPVKFIFPNSEAGFITSCRTFFETILERKILNIDRLDSVVQDILVQLKNKGSS